MWTMSQPRTYYCIADYKNGRIVHESHSEVQASIAFAPGTICGKGKTPEDARAQAIAIRNRIRKQTCK